MSVTDPTLTRHADGRVTVEWPDPPRRSYEVAHEVIQGWVDTINARRARDEAIIDYTAKRLLGHCAVPRVDIDAIIAAADLGTP